MIIGIDLGTTHTVAAYADPAGDGEIHHLEIEQLVAPGQVAARPQLASQRYHPMPGEIAPGDLQLPWPQADPAGLQEVAVGQLARQLGAQVPGRLVTSAKSWLSHAAVDRTAAILPWGAEPEVPKVSPLVASASYLAHVRAAWDHRFPDRPLAEQQIVLTVPASFDDGARVLTLEAARMAGLPAPRLLEEPQAAFHDWLHRHRATLATDLASTRLVLVCDVGGGTTDLSLIRVGPGATPGAPPTLDRVAVGEHLMLGGDNMDLALAHRLEAQLGGGERLSAARLAQLVERSRAAKEALLAADAPHRLGVTLLGGGSRLVRGARTVELTRSDVEAWLVDGFFPRVAATDKPARLRGGLVAFGLPYASDAAITRHVAAFLQQHAGAVAAALGDTHRGAAHAVPDTLLLNGGVFRAAALRDRLLATLGDWRGAPLRLLGDADPDLAVARGAVAHALARLGHAPRIGGGSARSYFLLQGEGRPAVCLLPQGSAEGEERRLADRRFVLRVGEPVRFHLASQTAAASGHAPAAGELVELAPGDHVRLPPIATVVSAAGEQQRDISVELATRLTELGTLELHCISPDDAARRWQLEFQLRGATGEDEGTGDSPAADAPPPGFDDALQRIDRVFGSRSAPVDPKDVKQLRAQLERALGDRDRWPPPLLRRLFDALWQRARGRRRSSDHERLWLNLAGYCLRPGFGMPLDDWRVEQLWSIFESGVQHPKVAQVGSEWWTLWRRVAGGLTEAAQLRLLQDFAQNLESARKGGPKLPANVVRGAVDDMLRLGAALERIPAEHKVEVGDWLLDRLANAPPAEDPLLLWALGRLGSRQPLHGSAHAVVPPEAAARWLTAVLAKDWKRVEGAAFAAAHIARRTDDRARDLPEALREEVVARLEAARAAPGWITMVREGGALDEEATRHAYGEALPAGLKLVA
ncbi:Hsp70 family protein [Aquincola sp. MAHUQ-54]|uniref:Hsp70 family protein n=1 Tax=Aquincola agrisoli TaxID=3119538 RepID=A0AAW9QPB1_9BURK